MKPYENQMPAGVDSFVEEASKEEVKAPEKPITPKSNDYNQYLNKTAKNLNLSRKDLDKQIDINKTAQRYEKSLGKDKALDFAKNQYKNKIIEESLQKLSPETEVNKQPNSLSLKERRKEWHKGLREKEGLIQNAMKETNEKYRKGEIGNREYNKIYNEVSKKYDVGAYPRRDRLPVENDIDANEKEFEKVRGELQPLEEEDSIAFNTHLMYNTPYDEKKKNPRIAELNKQLSGIMTKRDELNRQKASQISQSFGRKDYRKEIDEESYGKGNDRIYSLYQKSLEKPYLDFSRMIANDIDENREQYPDRIEFEDDLYEISESGGAYDHYKKENGKWEHVSTGTIAGLGRELEDKLEQENIVETSSQKPDDYNEFDEDYIRSYGVPTFKEETSVKKLVDVIDKYMGEDDETSIDIMNNAMERLEQLVRFSPEEVGIMASGTGEQIMDILRSKIPQD